MVKRVLLPTIATLLILCGTYSFNVLKKGTEKAWYECGKPDKNGNQLFPLKKQQLYFHFEPEKRVYDLKKKGFLWANDEKADYFLAYLINETDTTVNIQLQDRSLKIIREALDEKGTWKPIEHWTPSWCGNSYMESLTLAPGTHSLIPIKIYPGGFKTKARLKMKMGKNIYYSDSFDCTIPKKMFNRTQDAVDGILYHGPADFFEE